MINITGPLRGSRPALVVLLLCAMATIVQASQPRGEELLQPFKRQLMNALQAGMQQGGPAGAIEICHVQAPQISADLSQDGVLMGRTSHRLRNPANEPPDWVIPILDRFLAAEGSVHPVEVAVDDERRGYVEPIRVQTLCLGCHGKELAPGVAARIDRLYPQDQATGFSEGDLRGVFWVEYPANEGG